jgi:hypothetical protein
MISYQNRKVIANETEVNHPLLTFLLAYLNSRKTGMERRCENEKGKRNDRARTPLFDRKR